MKKLIIARHGDYNDNSLNHYGRCQIAGLAENLKAHIGEGASILLLHSPVTRARESAEILGVHFGVAPEEQKVLVFDYLNIDFVKGTFELVRARQEDADILILMTHLEHLKFFTPYFVKQGLGVETKQDIWDLGKGCAWVVDCEKRSIEFVV